MAQDIPRGVDIAPKDTGWWHRSRRAVLSASLRVEQGQSRVQQVRTSMFPSRFLHDPYLSISAVADDLATNGFGEEIDPFDLRVTVGIEANARVGVSNEIDEPPDDEDSGWSLTSAGMVDPAGGSTLFVGASNYTELARPLTNRAEWDDEGTYDFVRIFFQVQTFNVFSGVVDLTCALWANERTFELIRGVPRGEVTSSHLQEPPSYGGAI